MRRCHRLGGSSEARSGCRPGLSCYPARDLPPDRPTADADLRFGVRSRAERAPGHGPDGALHDTASGRRPTDPVPLILGDASGMPQAQPFTWRVRCKPSLLECR